MRNINSSSNLALASALLLIVGLTGCSDFRQAIGTEKSSPDEFEVVVRPPLSLPPGFGARPSAGDDGQVAAVSPAVPVQESELLVSRSGKATEFDEVFAFDKIEKDIRIKIDEETNGVIYERRLPLQILFGDLPKVGPVVDTMAEDARIRRNRLQKKALNEGATPAIDEVLGEPVSVE
jgi:hypothetical protein